jgi:hypothetical protein
MQTITVNLLKATKNTGRKLSVQFMGLRETQLFMAFGRTPELAAQQFAAALLSNAPSAANLGGLIVGELVPSEATTPECGARIVRRFVFKVLTVAPSVRTEREIAARAAYDQAQSHYCIMLAKRDAALRAKYKADRELMFANEALDAADLKACEARLAI